MSPPVAAIARPHPAAPVLPTPGQLASLGTVLCLFRGQAGGELSGWAQSVRASASAVLDSDGLCECLSFQDATGDDCWKLFLLPDSNFLAWERLAAALPCGDGNDAPRLGVAARLLQRLAVRTRGQWQASVLQLHALANARRRDAGQVLAASLAAISPLGAAEARRIARRQGAADDGLRDECCCERAARHAPQAECNERDPVVRIASSLEPWEHT